MISLFFVSNVTFSQQTTPFSSLNSIGELNDNSFQAGARNIHYELIGTNNKIGELVVYDDGHGMVKDMLTVAVTWGGTHRQNSRKGFGKYGYGLQFLEVTKLNINNFNYKKINSFKNIHHFSTHDKYISWDYKIS